MQHLLYLLPALGCPVGMGAMMWFMMRSGKPGRQAPPAPPAAPVRVQEQEIAALRAEVDQLRAAQRELDGSDATGPRRRG